jgi:hypothetical protein
MRGYYIVTLLLIGFLLNSVSQIALAKNNTNQRVPFLEQLMTHSLQHYEVQNIKVENDSGLHRVFSIIDGYQERVLRKVVYWLNNSSRVNGTTDVSLEKPSNKLILRTVNDEVITIEPAYKCVLENKRNNLHS